MPIENLIDDGTAQESLDQYLTPEERILMSTINESDFDRYLAATMSYDAMKAYLANPNEPELIKAQMDLNGWR